MRQALRDFIEYGRIDVGVYALWGPALASRSTPSNMRTLRPSGNLEIRFKKQATSQHLTSWFRISVLIRVAVPGGDQSGSPGPRLLSLSRLPVPPTHSGGSVPACPSHSAASRPQSPERWLNSDHSSLLVFSTAATTRKVEVTAAVSQRPLALAFVGDHSRLDFLRRGGEDGDKQASLAATQQKPEARRTTRMPASDCRLKQASR